MNKRHNIYFHWYLNLVLRFLPTCCLSLDLQFLFYFYWCFVFPLFISGNKAVMSCQPRVTVASCFVNKVIMDLSSLDHLCINPIHRIGLIHPLVY